MLYPGLAAWVLAVGLLLLSRRAKASHRRRSGLCAVAAALFLAGVWWTLGGVGAWRAGVARLANGTASVAEGTLELFSPPDEGLQVGDLRLRRPPDGWVPALHATRWPAAEAFSGRRVRLSVFYEDVLRLEVAEKR